MRTTGKQCGLAATGVYQPSLRSPWLAASEFREVPAAAPTLPVASLANSGEPMVTSSAKRVVEEPCA